MALMKLSTFKKRFVKGDAPDTRTVLNWIDKGLIYGEVYGEKSIYVDPDRQPEIATDNPLVARVLAVQGKSGAKQRHGAQTNA